MLGWSRWRRSKGFGIHSPFAFDFVQRTLHEKAEYYSYDKLRDLLAEAKVDGVKGRPSLASLTLVVRLIARFKPQRVYIGGDSTGLFAQAVMLADSRIALTPAHSDMVILAGRDISPQEVAMAKAVLARSGVVAIVSRHRRSDQEAITASMTAGMTFHSRHRLVAVGLRHLPRQNFEINF